MTISKKLFDEATAAGFIVRPSSGYAVRNMYPEGAPSGEFVEVIAPSGVIADYVVPANDAAVIAAVARMSKSPYGGIAAELNAADPWYLTKKDGR